MKWNYSICLLVSFSVNIANSIDFEIQSQIDLGINPKLRKYPFLYVHIRAPCKQMLFCVFKCNFFPPELDCVGFRGGERVFFYLKKTIITFILWFKSPPWSRLPPLVKPR